MKQQLKEKILDHVMNRNHVSFAELMDFPNFDGNKEWILTTPKASNLVLWTHMSNEAIDAIDELIEEKKIVMRPACKLTYLVDGAGLKYPIMKSIRHYKTPRWMPVCFCRPE